MGRDVQAQVRELFGEIGFSAAEGGGSGDRMAFGDQGLKMG